MGKTKLVRESRTEIIYQFLQLHLLTLIQLTYLLIVQRFLFARLAQLHVDIQM